MITELPQYIPNHQIDKKRWDSCIEGSNNGLVYAYSFYLDNMSKNWDALILGNYEAVMPLPWNRKFGIKYFYQPAFTQQLGIFSAHTLKVETIEAFVKETHNQSRFAELFLNYGNQHPDFKVHTNFVLPLTKRYSEISKGYKKDLLNNLKITAKNSLTYKNQDNLEEVLAAFENTYGERLPGIKQIDYSGFKRVCEHCRINNELILRGVFDSSARLLASALLISKRNRFYLLQSTTSKEGRQLGANHFLLDQFIQEFAGQQYLLDFEGSDIPGIAHFYQNFGAVNEPYFFFRYNALPKAIRWIKE